jgi:hypothetical protein
LGVGVVRWGGARGRVRVGAGGASPPTIARACAWKSAPPPTQARPRAAIPTGRGLVLSCWGWG